jgi:hypothetical protein
MIAWIVTISIAVLCFFAALRVSKTITRPFEKFLNDRQSFSDLSPSDRKIILEDQHLLSDLETFYNQFLDETQEVGQR